MTATLIETLRALQGKAEPSAAVFRTHEGTPYQHIAKVFGAACRRVEFKDVSLTTWPHLVMAGVDLPTVQSLMGHKTITIAMRYTHLAPGHKRTAIAVVDRVQEKVPAIFTTGRKATDKRALQVLKMGG
jgi:integrase